jgi:hypothetical protein
MSPENVQFALTAGTIEAQGPGLTQVEVRAVSQVVTGKVMAKEPFAKQAF